MTKGPVPEKAIELVLPVARARGFVIRCLRSSESGIDLIIAGLGLTALICVCRTKHLNEPVEDIIVQFANPIAMLRRVPYCPGRCCEIWACDYYSNIRCFRLTGTGTTCLAEIGRDGNPIVPAVALQPERASGASDPVLQEEKVLA